MTPNKKWARIFPPHPCERPASNVKRSWLITMTTGQWYTEMQKRWVFHPIARKQSINLMRGLSHRES